MSGCATIAGGVTSPFLVQARYIKYVMGARENQEAKATASIFVFPLSFPAGMLIGMSIGLYADIELLCRGEYPKGKNPFEPRTYDPISPD